MRVFISIDIPKKIKDEIRKIQNMLPKFIGKKIESENLHLTLKFLGELDENKVREAKNKLRQVNLNEFEAEINELGVFSEKFIRIIWLCLNNCGELQKEIDEKLKDLFEKEKRFMGHLTIARVKKVGDKEEFLSELTKIKINPIKFTVSGFKLKSSILKPEGPVYKTIEGYSLKKKI